MSDEWKTLFPDAATNIAEYLIDGVATFASYVSTIETADAAGHYIYILGWMLDVDFPLTGTVNQNYGKEGETYFKGDKTLLKLLETATTKGVEVRVLVWNNPLYLKKNKRSIEALSKLPNTKAFLDDDTYSPDKTKKTIGLYETFIREIVKKIRPILTEPRLQTRLTEQIDIPPSELLDLILHFVDTKNVGAHHEKNLIVKGRDGLVAHCGGLDINQNRFTSYHDTACKLMGPAANQILQRFVRRWSNHGEAKSTTLTGANDVKPKELGPVVGNLVSAKVVGTYNSPDGTVRERSARDAYIKIVAKARNYIYIDDQYLVNLDVARALNKKICEPFFKMLIMVIQDSRETTDIMIPDRKRGEFFNEVIKDTSVDQKRRCALFMVNDDLARVTHQHPGLHAKTLIVDDELAVIGSANVNQRSFTLDSETSVIVFNSSSKYYRDNFAYKFRQSIWRDFILKSSGMSQVTWEELVRHVYSEDGYSLLRPYVKSMDDLDDRLTAKIKPLAVPLSFGVIELAKPDMGAAVQLVSVLNSEVARREIIDLMWDNLLDPQVD